MDGSYLASGAVTVWKSGSIKPSVIKPSECQTGESPNAGLGVGLRRLQHEPKIPAMHGNGDPRIRFLIIPQLIILINY